MPTAPRAFEAAAMTAILACLASVPLLAAAQPAPNAATQEARLKALEDKLRELEERTERAESKAAEAEKDLQSARAEHDAEIAAAKKKAAEDEALAKKAAADAEAAKKKQDEDEKAKALDFNPEKNAFDFGDFSWMPSNYAAPERPFAYGPFTGELRVDTAYHFEFSRPKDDTISGSSQVFRHNELQLTQLGIGGDFYYKGMQARLMTQFGLYSQAAPDADPTPGRGQWSLANAYRYLSEEYAGYHINALYGVNIQAGLFLSYIGMWSYYTFDNWTYQPSYISSDTPWYFTGLRVQIFLNRYFKIEPWLTNGWQSYGKFNEAPGGGFQANWRPFDWLCFVANEYAGADTLGVPGRARVHTDESVMARFFNNPGGAASRAAASLTLDAGCETGGEGKAHTNCQDQYVLGFMAYARMWLWADKIGLTFGGGAIRNPGRYIILLPPINGATGISGTPYFTENPGDKFDAWDIEATGDYMPTPFTTFRLEYAHRAASVPYFAGRGGMTPPGGNTGAPGSAVAGWAPDLVKLENRLTLAFMAKL